MSCLRFCVLFSQCSLFTAEHGQALPGLAACPGWLRPLMYTGYTGYTGQPPAPGPGCWLLALTLALIMLWLLSQSRGGDTQSGLQLAWLVT